jgi:hypothetical protein
MLKKLDSRFRRNDGLESLGCCQSREKLNNYGAPNFRLDKKSLIG